MTLCFADLAEKKSERRSVTFALNSGVAPSEIPDERTLTGFAQISLIDWIFGVHRSVAEFLSVFWVSSRVFSIFYAVILLKLVVEFILFQSQATRFEILPWCLNMLKSCSLLICIRFIFSDRLFANLVCLWRAVSVKINWDFSEIF